MFKFNSKKIIAAGFPILILLVAWVLTMGTWVPFSKLHTFFISLPYIFAIFALVLSVWFQHSRVLYATVLLFFSMIVLQMVGVFQQRALVNGLSLLLPTTFIVLAILEERGITGKHGRAKGFAFLLMMLLVVLDALRSNSELGALRSMQLIFNGDNQLDSIPRMSVFLFILCLCILLIRFLVFTASIEMSFTCVTLASFIILHFSQYPDVLSVYFSAVFLIFIFSLFDTSYSLAFHDPLTGVRSRRALDLELLRLSGTYSVAIVDIDFFKKVNDTYGHQVGDDVLKMVASIIEKNISPGKVFRYGGEEFIVIFYRKTKSDVVDILEELRIAIEKRPLFLRDADRPKKKPHTPKPAKASHGKVKVTVSIGIADNTGRAYSADEVIEAADKALYKAKKSGRNRVV